MKKLLILTAFILSFFIGFTQTSPFPVKQYIGSANTLIESKGGFIGDSALVLPSFVDTSFANFGLYPAYYPGNVIRVKDQIWMRNASHTKWLLQTPSAGTAVCSGLQFGGVVTWDSLLVFDITSAVFCVSSLSYTSHDTSITLAAADPSLDRYDAFVADTTNGGKIVVLQGTPNANPELPQANPSKQVLLAYVRINAGATTPVDVTKEIIYNENVEWTTGSLVTSGAVNFANTLFPYVGVKSANVDSNTIGELRFRRDSLLNISTYNVLQLFIRLKAPLSNSSNLQVAFTNSSTLATNYLTLDNTNGFLKNTSGSYQNISIPMPSFTITNGFVDGLRIRITGVNSGFYVDYIQLQNGIIPYNTNFDGRYLKLFAPDTTYAKKTLFDTLSLGRPQNLLSDNLILYPSADLNFQTYAKDTVLLSLRRLDFNVYAQGSPGTTIPQGSMFFKSPYATPLTLNADGTVTFANGISMTSGRTIFAGNTINYQSNSTTGNQHSFANQIGSSLTKSVVEVSIGAATVTSPTARAFDVLKNRNDTALSILPEGNIGIGIGNPNRYANIQAVDKGRGVVFDTMNTVKRNGINKQVATVTITNAGIGYVSPPSVSAGNSPVGGLNAIILPTLSSGTVTGATIVFNGSGYSSGGALTITGGGGTGATGTFTVSTGTLPVGLMIYNTDSLCYEQWNGSLWKSMCGGSGGGGGGSTTFQGSLDNGSSLDKDNTIQANGHNLTIDSLGYTLLQSKGTGGDQNNAYLVLDGNTGDEARLGYDIINGDGDPVTSLIRAGSNGGYIGAQVIESGVSKNTTLTVSPYRISFLHYLDGVLDSVIVNFSKLPIKASPPTYQVVMDGDTIKRYPYSSGGGGGTVTSVSRTNGYGITASVASSTTTPNITIAVDTATLFPAIRATIPSGGGGGITDSLYFDPADFSITSGGAGPDTVRVNENKPHTLIDLNSGPFTITEPGVYELLGDDGGAGNDLTLPDPATFSNGAKITIFKTNGLEADMTSPGVWRPFTLDYVTVLAQGTHNLYVLDGKWYDSYVAP